MTGNGPVEAERPESDPLSELARRHGVQRSYTGADGVVRTADPDTLVAVLAAMGVSIDRAGAASDVLRGEQALPPALLQPVIARWEGSIHPVPVRLPASVDPASAGLTLVLDTGAELSQPVSLASAGVGPLGSSAGPGSVGYVEYQLRMAPGTAAVPSGYHRLAVEMAGCRESALVVVAPRCPRPRRGWGVSIPLHALRGGHDWGAGSFADLADLAEWIGELGGSFVGTLPLFPAFLDAATVDPSPYLPVSRLGWNEIYVDPTLLPELSETPESRRLLTSPDVERQLVAARNAERVEHKEVMALLRSMMEPMARTLFESSSRRREELDSFVAERPHLKPYARFRATASGVPEGGAASEDAVRYHLYAQWAAETQLAEAARARDGSGAGLYLDLPVGVHPGGFDPTWEPDAFVAGMHGGAPPDIFFRQGQDWAFPPLDPRGLRAQEYRYLISVFRHAFHHADVARIDHVMGLHRLYWIPEGADATDGVYVHYAAEEMRAIAALEADRAGTAVVGEDLGTVSDGVRADMEHDGLLRSWVFQFGSTSGDPLPDPPVLSLASLGTHDLATFAGYWAGLDIDTRKDDGAITDRQAASEHEARREWRMLLCNRLALDDDGPGSALRGCLDHLASGPARLVLVDLEDLWLERVPQNRPGTGVEAANWRRRSARTMAQFQADPEVIATLSGIDERRKTGPTRRGNP
ncbi:MAG: 4-alpha-glucanotransferase [Acidimicrobiales bacterium]